MTCASAKIVHGDARKDVYPILVRNPTPEI